MLDQVSILSMSLSTLLKVFSNWLDYGGMDTYTKNVLGNDASHSSFYTDNKVIDAYKTYTSNIVKRYKDS